MKHLIIYILLCLAGAGFLLFFLPVPVYGVFNIGNITGMLVFAALFFGVLFRAKLWLCLQAAWRPAFGKAILCAATAGILAAAVLFTVTGARIIHAIGNAPPQDTELTVVVLGCRVYPSGPSRMLRSRINTAYDYLIAHPDAVCILSGAQGEDEPESEAQAMFDALTEEGIDPKRLLLEDESRSTLENIAFSMRIIKEKGLPEGIALVTSEYHQYRAGLLAANAGCETCFALSAPSQKLLLPTYFVRELFGVIYARLGGTATYRVL